MSKVVGRKKKNEEKRRRKKKKKMMNYKIRIKEMIDKPPPAGRDTFYGQSRATTV
jgi:hypothetical protein